MKLSIAPDNRTHVIELAILAALGAGLTVLANNIGVMDLGNWSAVVASGVTIVLSVLKNLQNS